MRLYLDSATRVFRYVSPPGAGPLPVDTSGLLVMDVADSAWHATYEPAWQAAQGSGQDLVVAVDGSTSQVAHVATPREQAYTILTSYLANPAPLPTDTALALKTLIRVFRALV